MLLNYPTSMSHWKKIPKNDFKRLKKVNILQLFIFVIFTEPINYCSEWHKECKINIHVCIVKSILTDIQKQSVVCKRWSLNIIIILIIKYLFLSHSFSHTSYAHIEICLFAELSHMPKASLSVADLTNHKYSALIGLIAKTNTDF